MTFMQKLQQISEIQTELTIAFLRGKQEKINEIEEKLSNHLKALETEWLDKGLLLGLQEIELDKKTNKINVLNQEIANYRQRLLLPTI